MVLLNTSSCSVAVTAMGTQYTLESGQSLDFSSTQPIILKLSHLYSSKAASDGQLLSKELDVSLVSVLTASQTPPSFELVMDTEYALAATDETVQIVRERFRASVDSSYDRFALRCSKGIVLSLGHTVPERHEYVQKYGKATRQSNKLLIALAIVAVAVELLGLIGLVVLTVNNGILGLILGIFVLFLLLIPFGIVYLIAYLSNKAEQKLFERDFDHATIAKRFEKAIAESDESLIVD